MPSFINQSGQVQRVETREMSFLIRNRTILPETIITLDDNRKVPAKNISQLRSIFDEVGPPPPSPPKLPEEEEEQENKDRILRTNEYYEYTTVAIPSHIVVNIPYRERANAAEIKSKSCESYAEFINEKLADGWEICTSPINLDTVDVVAVMEEEAKNNNSGCLAILFPLLFVAKAAVNTRPQVASLLAAKTVNMEPQATDKNTFVLLWFRRVRSRL
jgi:hypothetical protein